MQRLLTLVGVATLLAACSNGSGTPDGGGGSTGQGGAGGTATAGSAGQGGAGAAGSTGYGGAGTGGASGGGGGGGNSTCATATENAACTVDGATCGGPCTDVCQFCNLLRCTSGRWQRSESAPAPCFTCGPDLRCQGFAQYCDVTSGGAVGAGSSYHCTALPAACTTTPTCACLQTQGVAGSGNCAMAAQGAVTVTLLAPASASDAGAPLTACPASRPALGTACSAALTCNYDETCTAHGCCSSGYGCSNGVIIYLGYNDGCMQIGTGGDAATD
jgi:hypothetical protein